jgi:membrane-associated phospholipid phosphatase
MKAIIKYFIGVFISLFIVISTGVNAQSIDRDTVPNKDSALKNAVGKIIKSVGNYVAPEKDADEDSVCYSDRCVFDQRLATGVYGLRQFTHETVLFMEAPTRWHKKDFIRLSAVIVGIAAIMPFDQKIASLTQGNQHYYYSVAVVGGRIYGEWYSIGSVTAIFAGYGILAHDNSAKKIAIELVQAGAYSEFITELLKIGIGRYRPYEDVGPFKFHPFNLNNNTESMPSGHSTSAFALSTVMSRHAHSTFLKLLAYAPACFTLFARIYQDDHWGSDVFFGSAVGLATGSWVVTLHEGRRHKINIPADNK